jgi:flagellin-specific chaperone FliS
MKLKYVGPKPIISHTGIEFDNNKEDKYVFLNIAVQLLKALDHDYFEDKTYTYEASTQRLSPDELYEELKKLCPNISSLMEKENHNVEDEINHNLQRAQENSVLNEENKTTLQNNINIMHDYIVQRSINKSVYYCVIDLLAELLKKDHIDHVIAPMFQKFAHVFHSIQGSLRKQKFPIDTALDVYEKDGELLVKLQVINT